MKKLLFLVLLFCFSQASAQNLGNGYDFIKFAYKSIPLHANLPYYDTTVSLDKKINKAKLTENATSYFDTFDTKEIKANAHTYIVKSSYSYFTTKKEDSEHFYTVNYALEVSIKKGYFTVVMYDFILINQDRRIDFSESIKTAEKNNGICNQFLAFFHKHNQKEINKACKAIINGKYNNQLTTK